MTHRRNQCSHIRPDGSRCRAAAMKGAHLCFYHNPATADARRQARRRGAAVRNAQRRSVNRQVPLDTILSNAPPERQSCARLPKGTGGGAAAPHADTNSYMAVFASAGAEVLLAPIMDIFLKVRDGLMDSHRGNSLAYIATVFSQLAHLTTPGEIRPSRDSWTAHNWPMHEGVAVREGLSDCNPLVRAAMLRLGIKHQLAPDDSRWKDVFAQMHLTPPPAIAPAPRPEKKDSESAARPPADPNPAANTTSVIQHPASSNKHPASGGTPTHLRLPQPQSRQVIKLFRRPAAHDRMMTAKMTDRMTAKMTAPMTGPQPKNIRTVALRDASSPARQVNLPTINPRDASSRSTLLTALSMSKGEARQVAPMPRRRSRLCISSVARLRKGSLRGAKRRSNLMPLASRQR